MTGVIDQTWLAVDEFVEPFELAWRADAIPEVTRFLPPAEHPQFRETLLELLRVDLELRWQNDCAKSLDEYRREFSEWLDDAESLSQLAFEEFRTRLQAGEAVSADEYAQRFGIAVENWPDVSCGPHDSFASDQTTAHSFPTVGSTFLSFHLQSELGRGAFSRVYLARQGDLANRLVVLKVSAESFAEADKLAQLQHANIVPIYSVHRAGTLSAVVMPYFGAATLADVVREVHGGGSLPPSGRMIVETLTACGQRTEISRHKHDAPVSGDFSDHSNHSLARRASSVGQSPDRETGSAPLAIHARDGSALKTLSGLTYVEAILWIGAKLAQGLSHAHERGILHRDLKPANVLLADDGRPMLLDFNLSADVKQSAGIREKLVGGTLPYMAPEQIDAFQQRDQGGDARSDLYSLGVILFELLAGRNPFPTHRGALGPMLSKMLHDRQQTRPKLRAINPAVTPAVEAIVQRCLEPDPAQRYQSAAELHEDLERHLKQQPLRHTREPSLRERANKWTRRNPRLTAVLSVALAVGGVSWAVATHRENNRIKEVEAEIAALMRSGREALDDGDAEVAHGRFLAAWMKVQAEPALIDHQPGVAGWLDHSRRAAVERQIRWQVPPRDYDKRRDEALLHSMLLDSLPEPRVATARQAIQEALDLTLTDDPGWTREREQLKLLDSELIEAESGADAALKSLDATHEFASRAFLERRIALLEKLNRAADATALRSRAEQFPLEPNEARLLNGIRQGRLKKFDLALHEFELVLQAKPESFTARLLQAVCFLQLSRAAEARIALTSCIAQQPQFAWSFLICSEAHESLGDLSSARADLERVLELRPSAALRQIVDQRLKQLSK